MPSNFGSDNSWVQRACFYVGRELRSEMSGEVDVGEFTLFVCFHWLIGSGGPVKVIEVKCTSRMRQAGYINDSSFFAFLYIW